MAYYAFLDPSDQRDPWQYSFDDPDDGALPEDFARRQPTHSRRDTPPRHPPPKPRPIRIALAWLAIAVCTVALMVMQFVVARMDPPPPTDTAPGMDMVLFGRLAVGLDRVLGQADPQFIVNLEMQASQSPFAATDELRVAVIVGETQGNAAAADRLAQAPGQSLDPVLESEDVFMDDRRLLERIYSAEQYVPDPAEARGLIQRHGWFGELAAGYNLPRTDALYSAPRQSARNVIVLVFGFAALLIFAFVVGFLLFIGAIIAGATGKLSIRFEPGEMTHASAYLETVAVFLIAFIALQPLAIWLVSKTGFDLTLPMLALLVLPVFWPLVCGVGFKQYRSDMGLHARWGIFREIGAGVVGYLAGLPIVFVGFVCTAILAFITAMQSEHPAGREIMTGSTYEIVVLFIAAVLWAPVVEELIFRAAFYRHLRRVPGWATWLLATVVTSFIFAAIHPQGIVGIPVLMSIAFVLAMLRQWRGSLVAPVTAHALHNGTIISFAIVLFYL